MATLTRKSLVDNVAHDVCVYIKDKLNIDISISDIFAIKNLVDNQFGLVVDTMEEQSVQLFIEEEDNG